MPEYCAWTCSNATTKASLMRGSARSMISGRNSAAANSSSGGRNSQSRPGRRTKSSAMSKSSAAYAYTTSCGRMDLEIENNSMTNVYQMWRLLRSSSRYRARGGAGGGGGGAGGGGAPGGAAGAGEY